MLNGLFLQLLESSPFNETTLNFTIWIIQSLGMVYSLCVRDGAMECFVLQVGFICNQFDAGIIHHGEGKMDLRKASKPTDVQKDSAKETTLLKTPASIALEK